jgi:alpha,alpha-trehalase
LKKWGFEVNAIWRTLSKRFIKSESRSSIIECPFPFMIAGGRFREFYNWDSLWITEGLIISDMIESANHMI